MDEIWISESVRRKLSSYLLEERDLIENIRKQEPAAIPGQAGSFQCTCTVAVRRPLDPETAELCRVDVLLQKMETGWLVSGIEGLSGEIEES